MTTAQFFIDIVPFVLIAVIAIAIAVFLSQGNVELHPDAQMMKWRMFAVVFIFYAIYYVAKSATIYLFSQPMAMAILARQLYSGHAGKERRAIGLLSMVAGARYGHPGYFGMPEKRFRCCRMWQQWWERNQDCLTWDSELRVYTND